MEKIELFMDEKRNLFIKDKNGVQYDFWPLGWGTPVSFVVETKEEAETKRIKEREAQMQELERYEQRQQEKRKRRWFN